MRTNPNTDTYISNANDFAIPILEYMRKLIHEECPEVVEVIKWGFPCFEYKGILCAVTAHKMHCSFSFWKGQIMSDSEGIIQSVGKSGMGQFGKITSLDDLPSEDVFRQYLREAIDLNERGVKVLKKTTEKKDLDLPDYFIEALKKNSAAELIFEKFSYTNRKEYIEWVTGAKTEATRIKRLTQAVEWMAEGKIRNWKYLR